MGRCTQLANQLDLKMLRSRPGCLIHSETVADSLLPMRTGIDVAAELGGRLLLRYLRARDRSAHIHSGSPLLAGRPERSWVTPTPFSPREAIAALALPFPKEPRRYVVLLDPAAIATIQGPRRVLNGTAIEYLLPHGYPSSALAFAWELEVN